MQNMKLRLNLFAVILFLGLSSNSAPAATDFRSDPLAQIRSDVQAAVRIGQNPIVVFDLDDTLVRATSRTARIIAEFAHEPSTRSRYPDAVRKLEIIRVSKIRYVMADTLRQFGIEDSALTEELTAYWLARFFTNEYCERDLPVPYAARYVSRLARAGATIVYLSGRDVPRMGRGTVRDLRRNGFPLGPNAILLMKPAADNDDLGFKIAQFPRLRKMGTVVAAFENEPANINAFQAGFPRATMVFLDTIHSPKPDQPNPGVFWVRDFAGE